MKNNNTDDIRLQELPFSFDGRDYKLRCTMNVLSDLQARYGGDLVAAFDARKTMDGWLVWITVMINDYAETQNWPDFKPYTEREIGGKLIPAQIPVKTLTDLISDSMFIDIGNDDAGQQSEGDEKN